MMDSDWFWFCLPFLVLVLRRAASSSISDLLYQPLHSIPSEAIESSSPLCFCGYLSPRAKPILNTTFLVESFITNRPFIVSNAKHRASHATDAGYLDRMRDICGVQASLFYKTRRLFPGSRWIKQSKFFISGIDFCRRH
jgi:hypothetical protein